jgi:hypothetical protein
MATLHVRCLNFPKVQSGGLAGIIGLSIPYVKRELSILVSSVSHPVQRPASIAAGAPPDCLSFLSHSRANAQAFRFVQRCV